jgi:hypothetical protein
MSPNLSLKNSSEIFFFTLALMSGTPPFASAPSDMLSQFEFESEVFTTQFPLTHILEVMTDLLFAFAAGE